MKHVDATEVNRGREWLESLLGERLRYDGELLTPEILESQLRLYLAIRELNDENGFALCGIKNQRELTELVCIADVAEMLLNDPYDWNGPKESTVCATEADAYAAITMQLLKYVSGGLPTLFMDVRLYHPDIDVWDFCNSGQHASWYAAQSSDPAENLARVTFHPALAFYFKAGGASVEFDAKPCPLTFARLGVWDDRPFLVIIRGESLALSPSERTRLVEQTNPTWPHVWTRLETPIDEFVQVFPANHIQAVAGDHVQSLIHAAEIVGIPALVLGEGSRQPIWDRLH
jgi:L-fucose isomerase